MSSSECVRIAKKYVDKLLKIKGNPNTRELCKILDEAIRELKRAHCEYELNYFNKWFKEVCEY